MSNLTILNLEYSFIVDPSSNATTIYFESNLGLWSPGSFRIIDNLWPLRQIVDKINATTTAPNYISIVEPLLNSQLISLCFHGSQEFIDNARLETLRNYNQVNHKSIALSRDDLVRIDEKFTAILTDVCRQYEVEVVINDKHLMNSHVAKSDAWLHIVGFQDNITLAEPLVRVLISNLLHGHYLDALTIDLSLIPLIGGVNLYNFTQIAKQTDASIYIPDLLPNLFNSNVISTTMGLKVLITAKCAENVMLAKHILHGLMASARENKYMIKEIDLLKTKIDAMILYNQCDILQIMFRNGVFVQMPSLGEPDNYKIVVQGTSLDAVNDAIAEINLLSTDYYTVSIAKSANHAMSSELSLLKLSQLKKTCVFTSNKHGLQVSGSAGEIKQVLKQLMHTREDFQSVMLRLELSNSQRDFISGKKNGKLIKILNQLNQAPRIRFKPFNEYNFFIDVEIVAGTDVGVLLKGLELIELELPAELQFNIPEVFHKSIIGNGGSIIQSVMKKYNVFIKFTNTNADSHARDMYTFTRFNNVLIKCPRKNSKNIKLVKSEIDLLVHQCSYPSMLSSPMRNSKAAHLLPTGTFYHTVKFRLLRSHYLLMVNNNKLKEVSSVESSNGCFFNFPTSIDAFEGNDMVLDIMGSEAKANLCFTQLRQLLPSTYEFKITFMPGKFEDNFKPGSPNYEEFVRRVVIPYKVILGVELEVNEFPMSASTASEHHQILMSYYDDTHLEAAIHNLTLYLRGKGFLILDKRGQDFDPLVEMPSVDMIPSTPVLQFDSKYSSPCQTPQVSPNWANQYPSKYPQTQYSLASPQVSPLASQYNPFASPYAGMSPQPYSKMQSQLLASSQMMPLAPINLNAMDMAHGSPRKIKQSPRRKVGAGATATPKRLLYNQANFSPQVPVSPFVDSASRRHSHQFAYF